MKSLGIDFGKRKVGVAFSEWLLAEPLTTIVVKSQKQLLSEIMAICERLAIEKIILGLSGGPLDNQVRKFGKALSTITNIPVFYVDETLTSKSAVAKLVEGGTTKKKRREMEDAVAATIILNTYLESQQ